MHLLMTYGLEIWYVQLYIIHFPFIVLKQGRINNGISGVWLGRSDNAKTARKRQKRKQGTDQPTDRQTDGMVK